MKKNILFDTSCGSLNMGDYIICEAVERELDDILKNDFLVKIPTHTPATHFYQNVKRFALYKYCTEANYKFLAGTNILKYHIFLRPWANFNTNIFNCKPYKNTILVGAGSDKNSARMDFYAKLLYKTVLSKDYIHSVRDESTKDLLNSLGLKAINTGCPTMWSLNANHCRQIPSNKGRNVIFTVTDYRPDPVNDKQMIECLIRNYEKVYCWIQGAEDYEYLQNIADLDQIKIVGASLNQYRKALMEIDDLDYVGTRLHAGIFALQNKRRTVVLSVDNRTNDIKETYNFNVVDRSDINSLESMINSSFSTTININEENIRQWKSQFIKQNAN